MNFGKFEETNLFYIEKSNIYKNLGSGIKAVEFVLRQNENSIIFLEAKKSCPNAANRYESEIKEEKFEEYYSSISGKFIESFQIYLAAILNRFQDVSEIGDDLKVVNSFKDIQLKFILVIKNAVDVAWLASPRAELENRLFQMRKIWDIKIVVLNEELADKYHLLC